MGLNENPWNLHDLSDTSTWGQTVWNILTTADINKLNIYVDILKSYLQGMKVPFIINLRSLKVFIMKYPGMALNFIKGR